MKKLLFAMLALACTFCLIFGLTACDDKAENTPNDAATVPAPTVAVTGVTLNTNVLTLTTGQSYKLVATVAPDNATDKEVSYTVSAGSQYVSVSSDGTVKGLAVGPAVVSVNTHDGNFSALCSIAVTLPQPTGIKLNKTSLVLDRDATAKLTATIQPSGATGTVIFQSQDPAIAKVDPDGTVTGVKAGDTKIKAYLGTNITAECAVRVGYKVTVTVTGKGEVDYDKDQYYYGGNNVYLRANPEIGYIFDGWYAGSKKLSDEKYYYDYSVKGDTSITAKFIADPAAPKKNAKGYYEIEDFDDLKWATNYGDQNYVLKNDIGDAGSSYYHIDSFSTFSGIFDGNGYAINRLWTDYGLFERLDGGTVKNLTLEYAKCGKDGSDGDTYAGILAAKAEGATIENCRIQGGITHYYRWSDTHTGGIVGQISDVVIKNCSVDLYINDFQSQSRGYFGGIAGFVNGNCQISFCDVNIDSGYSPIEFSATSQNFGGIAGNIFKNSDTVTDCRVTGNLKFETRSTGVVMSDNIFVGGIAGVSYGTFERCYSAVNISFNYRDDARSCRIAGVCGCIYNVGTIKDSLYCGTLTAQNADAQEVMAPFSNKNGTQQNVYAVDSATEFEADTGYAQVVTSEQLTEEFFRETLNFGEGWIFENNIPNLK